MAHQPSGRSDEAAQYRKWYSTARWRKIREYQLSNQPLCEQCLLSEIVEPATIVHHKTAHKGNEELFWFGPFESLCKPHHDREGHLEDLGRTVVRFDATGWPI